MQERVEDALEEWERLTAPGRPAPTAADIDALAQQHSLLVGKWMAFPLQVGPQHFIAPFLGFGMGVAGLVDCTCDAGIAHLARRAPT